MQYKNNTTIFVKSANILSTFTLSTFTTSVFSETTISLDYSCNESWHAVHQILAMFTADLSQHTSITALSSFVVFRVR